MKRQLIILLVFVVGFQASAQIFSSTERKASNHLREKHWAKALSSIHKLLKKDKQDPIALYLLSRYYTQPDNPAFQLDSAYAYSLRSLQGLSVSEKLQERLRKFELDSAGIVRLREEIDSAIFEDVRKVNTEQAYLDYLENHPYSLQRLQAMEFRDEVAYLDALKENTHTAYLNFLKRYPQAKRASEARKKYDRLLYESSTKDKQLSSYERFLKEYPETPFRSEVERNIYELLTLSGEVDRFITFLQQYPSSAFTKNAKAILFHLVEESDVKGLDFFESDSTRQLRVLNEKILIPVLKNKKFGFITSDGREIIAPVFNELPDEYRCGDVTEDLIVLDGKIIARNGAIIFAGKIEEISDLGTGFLKVFDGNCNVVIHKSGVRLDSCVEDARMLAKRMLAVKRSDKWMLLSLTGRSISSRTFDDATTFGQVLGLKEEGRWNLLSFANVIRNIETRTYPVWADEVKLLAFDHLLLRQQNNYAVVRKDLSFLIPFGEHDIKPHPFGYTVSKGTKIQLVTQQGDTTEFFDNIILQTNLAAVNSQNTWKTIDLKTFKTDSVSYDSVRFVGVFALKYSSDSVTIDFKQPKRFKLPATFHFVASPDSSRYLVYEEKNTKSVYDANGNLLFTGLYDQVQSLGSNLFIVTKKEKKGLVNSSGKTVLPVEYDAIGSIQNGVISLLRAMKFGLYDVQNNRLLKPQYEKNLLRYNAYAVGAYKDGAYQFIGWNNKPFFADTFQEIQYWNDSVAMVKSNNLSGLFNLSTGKFYMAGIESIRWIEDSPEEKLAIIKQEKSYGVISNKRGVVIPVSFTDLVNVGSKDEPVYFTEKHVQEASIFVVIYYDKNGRLLRREVYEDSEDYESIYCTDN